MSKTTALSPLPGANTETKKLTIEDLQKIRGAGDPEIRFRVSVELGRVRAVLED